MNIAALVEYDGTNFAGFQRQSSDKGPTVQGAIEAAIQHITGTATSIEGAGRTDSGVHASGQVINFQSAARLGVADWQRALNALLPGEIAIRATCQVADDFRSRKSALARSYRYCILCDAYRAPLRERFAWRVAQRLDTALMQSAVATLLGEHDFGAFGSSPQDRRSDGYRGHTVRTILAADCQWSANEPDLLACHFTANAFLSGMVRRLVGTLALVGDGRLSVTNFQQILAAGDKTHPGAAAPANGLCLTGVAYPEGMLTWQP